eukprot:364579-Chlamydomonas_euryale.AAC.11
MRDAQSPAQQVCKRPDTGRARAPVQAHQQQPLHAHKVWDAKHVVYVQREAFGGLWRKQESGCVQRGQVT